MAARGVQTLPMLGSLGHTCVFAVAEATQPLTHSGCAPQDLEWLSGRCEPRPGLHTLSQMR